MAKKRKSKKRSEAAKKAWRTRRRSHGKHGKKKLPRGHHRGIIGGVYGPSSWKKRPKKVRHGKHKVRGHRGNVGNFKKLPIMHCKKCGRTIFGGSKGLQTHMRNKHSRR